MKIITRRTAIDKYFEIKPDCALYKEYFAHEKAVEKAKESFEEIQKHFGKKVMAVHVCESERKVYFGIESDGEVSTPDFAVEMKASEFYKVIEDAEEKEE